jgi:hypothetical protein
MGWYMPEKLHTLTSIARTLGLDYRRMRDREVKPQPVAVVVISGREVPLYRREQFPEVEHK